LILFIFAGIGVKNLMRSKIGRAYAAIRDRDIAAEAIGINLYRFKASAFALSSFYAGVAGSLIFVMSGGVDPTQFNLVYSVTFIAIVIIGGAGTVLGPLFGAAFFSLIPGVIKYFLHLVGSTADQIPLHPTQIERLVFGLLLIGFLIFEPRGLWGIWFRLRNYFKAWPFSY
jgi:branched-chain amino acid transport system permease protein